MPSRFSQLYSSLAAPVLAHHLGESAGTVVWYPRGEQTPQPIEGDAGSLAPVFTLDGATDDPSRGHENVRRGTLTVFDTSIEFAGSDLFEINEETWIVRAINKGTDPWVDLELERRDREVTDGQGEKKVL